MPRPTSTTPPIDTHDGLAVGLDVRAGVPMMCPLGWIALYSLSSLLPLTSTGRRHLGRGPWSQLVSARARAVDPHWASDQAHTTRPAGRQWGRRKPQTERPTQPTGRPRWSYESSGGARARPSSAPV